MHKTEEYKLKCLPGNEPRIHVTDEFVKRNHLEINLDTARKLYRKEPGFLDFTREIAMLFLPFDEIKHDFQEEYRAKIESGEETWQQVFSAMEAAQDFLDYMVFAWMKANDERGISAWRSISKLSAWMRILSRSDVADVLEDQDNYVPYGKPALSKACEMLGISAPYYITKWGN